MANPTIRAYPVYYKGQKIAEAFENDYGIKPGRTPMFGAEGYYAHSKGSVQTSLNISMVRPVRGISITDVEDVLAQNDIDIGIPVSSKSGTKFHVITMAITEYKLKGNTEKGTLEGSMSLEGGQPNVQSV